MESERASLPKMLSRLNLSGGRQERGRCQYLSQNESGPMRVFTADIPRKSLGRQYLGFGQFWHQGDTPYACGSGRGMSLRQVLVNAHRSFLAARTVAMSGGKAVQAICDSDGARRMVVLKFGRASAEIAPSEALRLAEELRVAAERVTSEVSRG